MTHVIVEAESNTKSAARKTTLMFQQNISPFLEAAKIDQRLIFIKQR
jgi:hypothetical protein